MGLVCFMLIFAGSAAQAELVYEEKAAVAAPAASVAPAPVTPAQVAPAQTPTVVIVQQPAPVAAPVQTTDEAAENSNQVTASEILRRKRLRDEVKNEDRVQTRIEELRLRDEQKRTDKILNAVPVEEELTPAQVQSSGYQNVPGPYAPSYGPAMDQMRTTQASATPATAVTAPVGAVEDFAELKDENDTVFSLIPRIGFSGINNNAATSGYTIDGRGSFGVDAGVQIDDYLGLTFGYAYSRFTAGLAYQNPNYGYGYGMPGNFYGYTGNYYEQPIKADRHLVELDLQLFVLDRKSQFRPFILGGFGWARTNINYRNEITQQWGAQGVPGLDQDFQLGQILGVLGGGLDLRISNAVSFSAVGKFYPVLDANMDASYVNNSFYANPYYGGYGYNPYNYIYNQQKQGFANAISESATYSIMAGLNFTF